MIFFSAAVILHTSMITCSLSYKDMCMSRPELFRMSIITNVNKKCKPARSKDWNRVYACEKKRPAGEDWPQENQGNIYGLFTVKP